MWCNRETGAGKLCESEDYWVTTCEPAGGAAVCLKGSQKSRSATRVESESSGNHEY